MIQYKIRQNPQALFENLCISHSPYTGNRVISNTGKFKRYVAGVKPDLTSTPVPHIDHPVNIQCVFHIDQGRDTRLSDLLQTVDMLLVKYQVVSADVPTIIAGHDGSRCVYDKEHCTEIFITPISPKKKE